MPEPILDATHSSRVARAEELYEELKPLLVVIATAKFRVPDDEAEALVHDVFAAYLRGAARIISEKAWFVGAICNACRHYWRKHGRYIPLDEAPPPTWVAERVLVARLTADALLVKLSSRERYVIELRFGEGRTIRDLARVLQVSGSRAEKLLRRALSKLAADATNASSGTLDESHWRDVWRILAFQDAHPRLTWTLLVPRAECRDGRADSIARFDVLVLLLFVGWNAPDQTAERSAEGFAVVRARPFSRRPRDARTRFANGARRRGRVVRRAAA